MTCCYKNSVKIIIEKEFINIVYYNDNNKLHKAAVITDCDCDSINVRQFSAPFILPKRFYYCKDFI